MITALQLTPVQRHELCAKGFADGVVVVVILQLAEDVGVVVVLELAEVVVLELAEDMGVVVVLELVVAVGVVGPVLGPSGSRVGRHY